MSTPAADSPAQLESLEPGTSVRFRTDTGPGIALKDSDGLWAVPGMGKISVDRLQAMATDLTVLGAGPAWPVSRLQAG